MPIPKSNRLLAEERRREIVSVLGQHGRVTVEEVARRFGVSAVTARNDLDALSAEGVMWMGDGDESRRRLGRKGSALGAFPRSKTGSFKRPYC